MAEPKEPQSYGSEKDWVTGKTGQEVNRQKGHPSSQHADFYDSVQTEHKDPEEGGSVSPVQAAENIQRSGGGPVDPNQPVDGVTATPTGSKTDGYFKKRDYK
jgi:hypothetical protein